MRIAEHCNCALQCNALRSLSQQQHLALLNRTFNFVKYDILGSPESGSNLFENLFGLHSIY